MWGISLSALLGIDGLVGRCPANYLMPRMPIRDHPEAFSTIPCETVRYGVLVGVSTGYPPVAGRLHTRYAPVRRSPAAHCWAPLPLDLHVLSLPLAFILSQDQTLHCKNCLLSTFDSSRVSASRPLPGELRHTLSHVPK